MDHDHEPPPAGPAWDEATAIWYVRHYGEHPTNQKTVDLAQLQPDDRVLDIGCGSGPAVRAAAAVLTTGTVTGVDPTPAMIRLAHELSAGMIYTGRITYLTGPAENLPVADAAFNVAWAINAVNHWQDLARGLAEAYRALTPTGRLFITDELHENQSGMGDDSMNMDPVVVAAAVRAAEFVQVTVSRHPVGGEMMSLVRGTKPEKTTHWG